MEKWPILDQNHGLTLLEKCQFFDFLNLCFYSLERCFLVLEYRKRLFPGLYCLRKELLEKWPFLDQNYGLTLWENVNFLTFWTFRFYSLQRCLLVLEYCKTHFPGLYCFKKKSWKTGHFCTKSLKKFQFFDFLNFVFLYPTKVFFGFRIS